MKKIFFILTLFVSIYTNAQLSINSLNFNYTIDFNKSVDGVNNGPFVASGFASDPDIGQLDSDGIIVVGLSDGNVTFGSENTSGDCTRGISSGGIGTGGLYAFNVEENNYTLGFQSGGSDLTQGDIILKVSNTSGETISELLLQYDIWSYNDQERGNSITFSYSNDNLNYTLVSGLDFISEAASQGSPQWTKQTKSATLDIQIEKDEFAYLKWTTDDVNGSGSRDELALDDITISAKSAGSNTYVTNESLREIFIAPNPCNQHITVQANVKLKQIYIYDLSGNLIMKRNNILDHKVVIPTSDLKLGVYLIKIFDLNGNTSTRKIYKTL